MSLELDPVELGFRRPFTREVEEKLRLRNPGSTPVAFKVKTTAPKQYCVRPNSGRIEAGQQVEVSVLLQAMKEEPPMDAKCRDKFLVQSVAVSAGDEFTNVAQVWSGIEQTAKSSIQEKKIRVSFLPGGAASTPAKGLSEEGLPAYSSPISASTPQTSSVDRSMSKGETNGTAGQSSISAAASSVAAAVPTSTDELRTQLADLRRQVSALTTQQSEGMRQRNVQSRAMVAPSNPANLGMEHAPSGVPVQMVAGLCLLSFLIAYLLF